MILKPEVTNGNKVLCILKTIFCKFFAFNLNSFLFNLFKGYHAGCLKAHQHLIHIHVTFYAFRKLVIHPNGNKAKNVSDSLSLYLMMEKQSIFHAALEIHAVFKIFILDQNKDNYQIFEGLTHNNNTLLALVQF